jgi:hypothetical protein
LCLVRPLELGAVMQVHATCRAILSVACLVCVGCHAKVGDNDVLPFRIIATDAGFEAPDRVAAGLRHVVFENHGSEIHESMLVKLPQGMSAESYVAAVKKGSLFPEGALDYSDPGLTSPGETAEMWLRVDPGQYILICWNSGHAKTTPVHPFTVEGVGANDDRAPKEDLALKLFDYRFELSGDLHKGVQVIRIETPGPSMHEVDIYRLHEGKTAADLNSWRKQQGHAARLRKPWAARSTAMMSTGWCGCERTLPRGVTYCTVKCQSQAPN